jgi:hypothetical protein
MIKIEPISASAMRITVPDKLKSDDFSLLAPEIDSLITQYGTIKLLIDASRFNGWENIAAFEKHAGFVKNHHRKIERIAVIAPRFACCHRRARWHQIIRWRWW